MSAIYSAAVMARTKGTETEVMVHDYEREVERACSREFLCEENRVAETSTRSLAHFGNRDSSRARTSRPVPVRPFHRQQRHGSCSTVQDCSSAGASDWRGGTDARRSCLPGPCRGALPLAGAATL